VGLGPVVARARVFVHEVTNRGAQAVARGAARCASQPLGRCFRLLPAAPLVVRRRCLVVLPRPLPAAPLVVRRRFLIVVPRPLPAAALVVRRRYLILRYNTVMRGSLWLVSCLFFTWLFAFFSNCISFGRYCSSVYLQITIFCIVYLRPEMKIIATTCMPEMVSDFSHDFKKMLESCPQVARYPL